MRTWKDLPYFWGAGAPGTPGIAGVLGSDGSEGFSPAFGWPASAGMLGVFGSAGRLGAGMAEETEGIHPSLGAFGGTRGEFGTPGRAAAATAPVSSRPTVVTVAARAIFLDHAPLKQCIVERAVDVWRSGAPAGSPPEARLQRKLIEWGYPRAERQVEVFGENEKFVARADVGLREFKTLEYDSDEHHGPRFLLADDVRQDRVEELGWAVVPVDRFDLRPSSTRLKETLDEIIRTRFGVTVTPKRVGDRVASELRRAS